MKTAVVTACYTTRKYYVVELYFDKKFYKVRTTYRKYRYALRNFAGDIPITVYYRHNKPWKVRINYEIKK